MDGFFSVALSIGCSLVIAGIAWGDSRRQLKITAAAVVALEAEQKEMAKSSTRDNQRIDDALDEIQTLKGEMKEVRENWVTRKHLDEALKAQAVLIINAVAERRSQQR